MSFCCEATAVSGKTVAGRAPGEKAALARWNDLGGLEVLTADFCRHAFLPHFHDTYMLATVEKGSARMRHEAGESAITPGKTILLNPGDLHDAEGTTPHLRWQYRVFFLPSNILKPLTDKESLVFRNPVSTDTHLWRRLISLHRSLHRQVTLLERSTAMTHLLEVLGGQVTHASITPEFSVPRLPLDRVKQYLQAHWAEAVSLDQLVQIGGLSRFHLLRSFRSCYGLAPHAFQLQLRVEKAKSMLFAGMSAKDAAVECGFFDQAHLTRTIRRYTGATPARIAAISSKP